jgi:hypothetical protein
VGVDGHGVDPRACCEQYKRSGRPWCKTIFPTFEIRCRGTSRRSVMRRMAKIASSGSPTLGGSWCVSWKPNPSIRTLAVAGRAIRYFDTCHPVLMGIVSPCIPIRGLQVATSKMVTGTVMLLQLAFHRLRRLDLRSRKPSPPPFSSMNSTPAPSKAPRIFSIAIPDSSRRSFSKSTMVDNPNDAASASSVCVISSNARAARHCAGVIINKLC